MAWSSRQRERAGMVALALWGPAVAVALAVRSGAPAAPAAPVELRDPQDPRVALSLTSVEREAVQRTMRRNVEILDGIVQAWARGDRPGMAAAAREMAVNRPSASAPSLKQTLPWGWTALGSTVHSELDAFAVDVAGLPDAEIPARLARVTAACVACHQAYRLAP
jgi:cytochrome c556